MKAVKCMRLLLSVLVASVLLSGCMPAYTLVKPEPVKVSKNKMLVQPTIAWNRVPHGANEIPQLEGWTQNGLALDAIAFIAGLPDGQAITKQKPKDDQKVPIFHANMTPQDLVSMIETYYRIRVGASVFETQGVRPVKFLGGPGIEFNYNYVGSDEVKRRGRSVLAIKDNKLFLMTLDGAALHYFDAAVPEFERLSANASLM